MSDDKYISTVIGVFLSIVILSIAINVGLVNYYDHLEATEEVTSARD